MTNEKRLNLTEKLVNEFSKDVMRQLEILKEVQGNQLVLDDIKRLCDTFKRMSDKNKSIFYKKGELR